MEGGGQVSWVRIQRAEGGESVRTPLDVATHAWVHHNSLNKPKTGPFVVLAYALPAAAGASANMSICVTDGAAAVVPWPAWHAPPQSFGPLSLREWISLPEPGRSVDALLSQQIRQHAVEEQNIEAGIRDRCETIRKEADDENFMESLDYYTTCRVKCAYLRLNADGLRERLAAIRSKIRRALDVLRTAPYDIKKDWAPPTAVASATPESVVEDDEDPNALCVPRLEDFDVPDAEDVGVVAAPAVVAPST